MLVVKIELHSAVTGDISEIGRTVIWNDGEGTKDLGNYRVAVCRRGSINYQKPARKGEVKNYPRLSYNVWRLVIRSLKSAFPEET